MNNASDLQHDTITDLQPAKSNILVTGGADLSARISSGTSTKNGFPRNHCKLR
jgi:hypothetical protein